MIRRPPNQRGFVYALAVLLAFSAAALSKLHADDAGDDAVDMLALSIPGASMPIKAAGAGPRVPDPDQSIFFGDADLRPLVELERMQIAAGQYQVGLEDGRTAVLTIDPALQARAETILAESEVPVGAIVVMTVDGRVLALAARKDGARDPSGETALEAWAPAASIFKIVTSAALLDAGVEPDEKVCYHGGLRGVDESHLVDDARLDGSCATFTFGLAKSQNAIIAKLAAHHLDPAALRRAAETFGFGRAPDFALPAGRSKASIPDGKLEMARVAAGFWQTELSAIQGAILADVIASGGLEVTPRIVDSVIGRDGIERAVFARPPKRALSATTTAALGAMMVETTEQGTAWSAFHDKKGRPLLDVDVAGKTGSLSRSDPYLHYSWFVGYAPADAPRVVVATVLGNTPTWRVKAHTAARMLLEQAMLSP
jgi:penicillin-binding protein A